MTFAGTGMLNVYRSKTRYAVTMAVLFLGVTIITSGWLDDDGLAGVASFATVIWVDVWVCIFVVLTLRNWDAHQRFIERRRPKVEGWRGRLRKDVSVRFVLVVAALIAFLALGIAGRHLLGSDELSTQLAGAALFLIRAAMVAAGGLWSVAWVRRIAAREAA